MCQDGNMDGCLAFKRGVVGGRQNGDTLVEQHHRAYIQYTVFVLLFFSLLNVVSFITDKKKVI